MAKGIHKGSEFNNIKETWNQNERTGAGSNAPDQPISTPGNTGRDDLDRVIEKEATEYDRTSKEDQLLSGDRASVNDDE
ncbi:hypothetical protein [Flavisolibacter tropicus]|uniref:Uncharacterized protein n=1 Tax=Flavisolibacter tropicus TaxID=1492898 RepID=A0A172U1W8_9BACT|nr:hypothetical protein [Flavisolibacter tropicus]ANE53168.1 hypothetical protein SY85_24540 [Flavisolibacter tropicus]